MTMSQQVSIASICTYNVKYVQKMYSVQNMAPNIIYITAAHNIFRLSHFLVTKKVFITTKALVSLVHRQIKK